VTERELPGKPKSPVAGIAARCDADLKARIEAASVNERPRLIRLVMLPWFVALIPLGLLWNIPLVGPGTFLTAVVLMMASAAMTAGRVIKHGWRFDRTPRPGAGFDGASGRLLVEELRLTSLARLTDVTRDTEVFQDLRISGAELAGLLNALAKRCNVDQLPMEPGPYSPTESDLSRPYTRLTLGMLLDAMERSKGPQTLPR
jgi:hypothetical protein